MRNLIVVLISLFAFACSKKNEETSSEIKFLKENPPILQPEAYKMDSKAVLISGARIMPATGPTIEEGNLLMENGRIKKISTDPIEVGEDVERIEAQGMVLTPGLIDVHSHMGVYNGQLADANEDTNEHSKPVTSDVWAEHGFWPQDPMLWRALAGGITTIQVLPGSANLIGGRSFITKIIPKTSARDMRFPGAPQGLKMACGENPKRVYRKKGIVTRMGNVAGYRRAFQEALEYARSWEEYNKSKKGPVPKRNFVSETLVKVLKGEILLHFHCYRADDIHNILDVAKEFGFKINSIQHGLEAYKLGPRLAEEGVATATWADWWGFKAEAYDGIPYNVALLHKAGAKAIVHSDSEIDVRFLNIEAAKALAAGKELGIDISENQALSWITHNAAESLRIADKIGSLEEGKMADVVLWDGHPFSIKSKTQLIFINGKKVFDRKEKLRTQSDFELGYNGSEFFDGRDFTPPELVKGYEVPEVSPLEIDASQPLLIKNVQAFVDGEFKKSSLLLEKGNIKKLNPPQAPKDIQTIDAENYFLTPGFIETKSRLGLFHINLDSRAQDTRVPSKTPNPDIMAKDSLNTRNIRIPISRKQGVTTAISSIGGDIVGSMAVAFNLREDNILQEKLGLYGNLIKTGFGRRPSSRSLLWNKLRQFIDDAFAFQKNPKDYKENDLRELMVNSRHLKAMGPILNGKKPWVLEVNRADDIEKVIGLKSKYPKINFVISGAAEAWVVSDKLKKSKIPVIITPSYHTPNSFDRTRARFDQAAYLDSKGIPFIISDGGGTYGFARIRQEAGFAVKYGLSSQKALLAITETPAKVFGLPLGKIANNQNAQMVLWNGNPLEPSSQALAIWIDGEMQSLKTRHLELGKKYLKALK